MIEREKLITAIERAREQSKEFGLNFIIVKFKETDLILKLLKEQEPVEPLVDVDTYVCPNCGHRLEHQGMLGDNVIFDEWYNFCPACGQAVKWNA